MMRGPALLLIVAAVVALGLVPILAPPFYANLLVPFYGYAIALLGFNLLFGYAGLLSFGHAMFLGLGAYGAAVIAGVWGIKEFEIVLLGVALAGALLVGLIRAGSLVFYPEFEILAIYLIVIGVLLLKPSGLFGKPAA